MCGNKSKGRFIYIATALLFKDEDTNATTNKELERLEREAAKNEASSDEDSMSLEVFTRKIYEQNRQMEAQENNRNLQQLLASSSDSDSDSADELEISDLDTRRKKDKNKNKEIAEESDGKEKDKESDSQNEVEELDKKSDWEQKENGLASDEQLDSGSEKPCKELDSDKEGHLEEQNEASKTGEDLKELTEHMAEQCDKPKFQGLTSDESDQEAEANADSDSSDSGKSSDSNSSEHLFKDKKRTKRKSWRQDKLLKTKISDTDTSDEERWWKRNEQRLRKKSQEEEERLKMDENDWAKSSSDEKKMVKSPVKRVKPTLASSNEEDELSPMMLSSTESSDSSIFQKKKKKRKKGSSDSDVYILSENEKQKKKKRRQANSDDLSDESGEGDNEIVSLSQKSELGESPGKGGRKNIRKVMTKHDLAAATRAAAKAEEERKKRITARQKLYNELFEVKEAEVMEKLVLDFDAETKTELISVNKDLVVKMKPHQAKGVKFMWDSCFESLNELKNDKGSGCILAHCMGLGKTFQVVSLVHTILVNKDTRVRTVLVVCPLSTVLNWAAEFRKWLKGVEGGKTINVLNLTLSKRPYERSYKLKQWHENGGVMIMGYEMFRTLTSEKGKRNAVRISVKETFRKTLIDPGPDLVVCDEGHTLKNETTQLSKAMSRIKTLRRIVLTGTPMQNNLKEYHCMVQFVKPNLLGTRKEFLNQFVNPISNGQFVDSTEGDVKVMKRRAHVLHKMLEGLVQRCDYSVLTPFLPPKHEYVVSLRLSEVQERLYKFYLTHFAQRAGASGSQLFQDWQALGRIWTHPLVLEWSTDKYEREREKQVLDKKGSLFSFFSKHKKLEDESETRSMKDFINDELSLSISSSSSSASSDEEGNKRPKMKKTQSGKINLNNLPAEINLISSEEEGETEKVKEDEGREKEKEDDKETEKQAENDAASNESNDDKENKDVNKEDKDRAENKKDNETCAVAVANEEAGAAAAVDDKAKFSNVDIRSDWWKGLVEPEQLEDLNNSAKLILLFAILRECEFIEDKLLVFSQSLFSLDLIEHFLRQLDGQLMRPSMEEAENGEGGEGEGEPIRWVKNKDYFRLDGSTPTESRSQWCKEFNREDNYRPRLFLISTRAGGLGINLTAANRVVIFDASWNPSHDIQSIFRIYRFGQKKPCYVYRFIAHGTMEEKVYERQVAKQSLASRVVDEQQIHRHYSTNDLSELYKYTPPLPREQRPTPVLPKDRLMAELLTQHSDWIEKYHEHDSLLENVAEEELNEEERQAAWDDYENDKQRGFLPITQQATTAGGPTSFQQQMVFQNQMELYYKTLRSKYPTATEQQMNEMLQSLMANSWFNHNTSTASASHTQTQQQPMQVVASTSQAATSTPQFSMPTYTTQQVQSFEKNLSLSTQTWQRGEMIGNGEIRKHNAAMLLNKAVTPMYTNLTRHQNLAAATDKLRSKYNKGLPLQKQIVNTIPLRSNSLHTGRMYPNTFRQNTIAKLQPNSSQTQSVNSRQLSSDLRRTYSNPLTQNVSGRMQPNTSLPQTTTSRMQPTTSSPNAKVQANVSQSQYNSQLANALKTTPALLKTGQTSLTSILNPPAKDNLNQLKTYSNKAMMQSLQNKQSTLHQKLMHRKGMEQTTLQQKLQQKHSNTQKLEEMAKRYKSRVSGKREQKKISVVTLDDDTNKSEK